MTEPSKHGTWQMSWCTLPQAGKLNGLTEQIMNDAKQDMALSRKLPGDPLKIKPTMILRISHEICRYQNRGHGGWAVNEIQFDYLQKIVLDCHADLSDLPCQP